MWCLWLCGVTVLCVFLWQRWPLFIMSWTSTQCGFSWVCLPSQVGCKALVFPTQFKTQKYYDLLKQSCPELEKSSPGGIKSKRWIKNTWYLCTELTAVSCLVSFSLHSTGSSRRTCTGAHLNGLGCPGGLPWPTQAVFSLVCYHWWCFSFYQASWPIHCHHAGLQAAWHLPHGRGDAGRGQQPHEAVASHAAEPLL